MLRKIHMYSQSSYRKTTKKCIRSCCVNIKPSLSKRANVVATWRRTRLGASSVWHHGGVTTRAWVPGAEPRRRRRPGGRTGALPLGTRGEMRRPRTTRDGAWTWTTTTAWREWSHRKVHTLLNPASRSPFTLQTPRVLLERPIEPLPPNRG